VDAASDAEMVGLRPGRTIRTIGPAAIGSWADAQALAAAAKPPKDAVNSANIGSATGKAASVTGWVAKVEPRGPDVAVTLRDGSGAIEAIVRAEKATPVLLETVRGLAPRATTTLLGTVAALPEQKGYVLEVSGLTEPLPPVPATLVESGTEEVLIPAHMVHLGLGPASGIWGRHHTLALYIVIIAFIVNSFSISVVHSMLSGTASMDFGGKRAAATAAGMFDGMQYVGGAAVGVGMGWMLQTYGWSTWGPSMVGFSAVGGILMLTLWNARPRRSGGGH
jgi:hypothetical protein